MICEGTGDKYSNYEINKNLYTPQTTKWLGTFKISNTI